MTAADASKERRHAIARRIILPAVAIPVLAFVVLFMPFVPEGTRLTIDECHVGDTTYRLVQVANGVPDGFGVFLFRGVGNSWRRYFVDYDSEFVVWGTVNCDSAGSDVAVFTNGRSRATLRPSEDTIFVGRSRRPVAGFAAEDTPLMTSSAAGEGNDDAKKDDEGKSDAGDEK